MVRRALCQAATVRSKLNGAGVQGPQGPVGERGPQGQQGPSGQSLGLRDEDGNLVGPLVSVETDGPGPNVTVLIDGAYPYGLSGRLATSSFGGPPLFRDAGCNGTAYLSPATQPWVVERWTSAAGIQARVVHRFDSSTAARAWKVTSQTVDVVGVVARIQ